MSMIHTVITVERGEGEQLPDGSIAWKDKPVAKKGLITQSVVGAHWTVDFVNDVKHMISVVVGAVYEESRSKAKLDG